MITAQAIFIGFFGIAAVWFGVVVFRTFSMVRSAIALLFSQTALGAMFLTMEVEFLGVLQIMMMATEMSIMAIFMVMFMMDPGGMGEMDMTHQKQFSLTAGFISFVGAVAVAVFIDWGPVSTVAVDSVEQTKALGFELLDRSMLIFEMAGITILTAMIAATAVAIKPASKTSQPKSSSTAHGDHQHKEQSK